MVLPIAPYPSSFNLAAEVLAKAGLLADKPALEISGDRPQVYSYARLEAAVRGCGTLLLEQALVPGDRVMLRLGNTPAFPVAFLAAIAVGLVPVPTSAALTEPEVTALAHAVTPALIVAGPGMVLPKFNCPVLPADQVTAAETGPQCHFAMGNSNRLAYIVFTSGSSGQPMAVAHAHRSILARRMMHTGWQALTVDDRLLHAGALNWTYTLGVGLLDPWLLGATALIPGPDTPAAALPQMLAQSNATIFGAAPGVYRQMLRAPIPELPALRHGLSAGEALALPVAKAWHGATGTLVHQALGLTECSTFISGSPDRPAPPGTIGFAQAGRRLAVLDNAGLPVAPGYPGTLAVHESDPGLMLGYFGQPEATAIAYCGEWFLTGDRVMAEADGAFSYMGRNDDMMNPGGFRVSPVEVETVMFTLPGIVDCAAVEVEVTAGTRIVACFYAARAEISAEALHDHAARHLARFKQPRVFMHLDALPRIANNKLNRAALRATAAHHLCPSEPK